MQGHSLPFLPTIQDYFPLTLLCFHTFSHSFMPFIFLHPSADTSPYVMGGFLIIRDEIRSRPDQTPNNIDNHMSTLASLSRYLYQTLLSLSKLDDSILAAISQQKSASPLPFQIKYTQDRDAGIYECQVTNNKYKT